MEKQKACNYDRRGRAADYTGELAPNAEIEELKILWWQRQSSIIHLAALVALDWLNKPCYHYQ
ncbi:hypothetical protein O9992_18415 [Vibrio lentus]|nr:hypothetical protein [Vibrio lentus]